MKKSIEENKKQTHQLLDSEYLTAPTKAVLKARIDKTGTAQFFDRDAFALLSAICNLLMDQEPENPMVNVALFIDERLMHNASDGWRYDCMPPDRIMYKKGLKNVTATALQHFDQKFLDLSKSQQTDLLTAIQKGNVPEEIWNDMDPKLFFEELLAEATAIFFSHPLVQTSINYVGMADAKGWQKLKLDQVENLEKRDVEPD